MGDSLNDLKRRCHEKSDPSPAERIARGEMIWIKGLPASADKGTVALRTSLDLVTIIREEDIHAVREQDDEFWVQVAAETSVLVRLEKIARVRPSSGKTGECGCGTQEPLKKARDMVTRRSLGGREFGRSGAHGFYFPGICDPVCFVYMECIPYGTDEQFCVPILSCYSNCE